MTAASGSRSRPARGRPTGGPSRRYWDAIASTYQRETVISCRDVHYGPLIPGDRELGLLPAEVAGVRCLEVGCGAGQNAISLSRRGAHCTAVDISAAQLRAGFRLARKHHVQIAFVQADMQALPFLARPVFDLVLSAYALPFVPDPAECIRAMAAVLRPGGSLVLSTAHPAAAGEWLEVDGQPGIFLPSYFRPPPDRRRSAHGQAVCRALPLSTVFAWLTAAGLQVDALCEPRALPVRRYTPGQLRARVPYWSPAWLALAEELRRVPVAAVFRATKPVPPADAPPKKDARVAEPNTMRQVSFHRKNTPAEPRGGDPRPDRP